MDSVKLPVHCTTWFFPKLPLGMEIVPALRANRMPMHV